MLLTSATKQSLTAAAQVRQMRACSPPCLAASRITQSCHLLCHSRVTLLVITFLQSLIWSCPSGSSAGMLTSISPTLTPCYFLCHYNVCHNSCYNNLAESDLELSKCIECGQCVSVCPVGALSEHTSWRQVLSLLQSKRKVGAGGSMEGVAGKACGMRSCCGLCGASWPFTSTCCLLIPNSKGKLIL